MEKNKQPAKMEPTLKDQQLEEYKVDDSGQRMTTNQGVRVSEDEHSLKAGERGPTLMEDFHFREKMTHFDHERIPERVVHARGFGAHGHFQVYEPLTELTRAKFLQDPSVKTPVFVRFSTVAGSRGSADSVRDVRGFATKFYTEEGVYDLVGNNIPVFFIQDAMKFPDLVHSFKPEPHNEMPQASTAHDTFWDFVTSNTETAHMIMWAMSDRAIPRSYRMMEGFGVHTFRLVNEEGKAHFVKFHWKPVLGVHSFVWDEAHKLAGKDPDFHRRDLYEAIEMGNYPEYELGLQVIREEDEFSFDFDILDPTKIWPEEQIPVRLVGKMTLTHNVDNVFAETEQAAFHPGHVVPGIDFSNDPLLQGRLFSYTDTQLIRLGGPNFHELPINRSIAPVHNNQRDGYGRMTINKGPVSYHKNALAGNSPSPAPKEDGGYEHYQEKMEGRKVRSRSDSFKDHFNQARLFWNSMAAVEKEHIVEAFRFELGKCKNTEIRQRTVDMFAHVSKDLAQGIAEGLGLSVNAEVTESEVTLVSGALSQENTVKLPATRKVAVIASNGFSGGQLENLLMAFEENGMKGEIISGALGLIKSAEGNEIEVDGNFLTCSSVQYDAVFVVGGEESVAAFKLNTDALEFIKEAYKHFKAVGALGEGVELLMASGIMDAAVGPGVAAEREAEKEKTAVEAFIEAVTAHRHWSRTV